LDAQFADTRGADDSGKDVSVMRARADKGRSMKDAAIVGVSALPNTRKLPRSPIAASILGTNQITSSF
jgi:hypothetical protein